MEEENLEIGFSLAIKKMHKANEKEKKRITLDELEKLLEEMKKR